MVDAGTSKVLDLCGGKSYIVTEFCQKQKDGTTHEVVELCGAQTFEATEFCQSANVVLDLCGSKTYKATEFCQSANVVLDLCGTALSKYTVDQECQNNIVMSKCNSVWFNPITQFCQESTNDVKALCGGNTYTATQICDKDIVSENLCLSFVEGTEREHFGKSKKQFCDWRDGQKYVYVPINGLDWMAENLNYEAAAASSCGYYTSCEYGHYYGRVNSSNLTFLSVCPENWRLPTREEVMNLIEYTGTSLNFNALRANDDRWIYANTHASCEEYPCDVYGFSVLPSGNNNGTPTNISLAGTSAYLWTSTPQSSSLHYHFLFMASATNFYFSVISTSNANAFAVRCVRGSN
jgi:uncharacterized protein (TIGR02145 family)